jgi:hypothetical protein
MQMREWRRLARVLALTALGLTATHPRAARADGAPEPPGEHERVVKIGPQAVVIVDAHGHARMYDDPSEDARACKSNRACWGKALGALSLFGVMVYEDLTDSVESSWKTTQPIEAPE